MSWVGDDITHSDWCPYDNKTDEDGSCEQCRANQEAEGRMFLAEFGGREGVRRRLDEERFNREQFPDCHTEEELTEAARKLK